MSKPIPFSTEMVRAILDGRKTQTRRVVKPQPENVLVPDEGFVNCEPDGTVWGRQRVFCGNPKNPSVDAEHIVFPAKCPYPPGTILWVKETWADLRGMGFGNDPRTYKPWNFAYKADITPGSESDRARIDYGVLWKSSRFMLKEAARIFLRVTDVRVERLQEIAEEDARAEGVQTCRDGFRNLWDSLSGKKYPWESNPWVWVISFERVAHD